MSDSSPSETENDLPFPPAFVALGLRNSVLKGVAHAGFAEPTDIQRELIPIALTGVDAIGQARTGTGKTAAFGLPILHNADPDVPMQALILVPTRELAAQVSAELDQLGKFTPIRSVCIIGGESIASQSRSLKKGVHILVGTPGRVMDMYDRRQINFDRLRFVVLDEVDRMLDIGFREDIRNILGKIKCAHQTIFVSATVDEQIERLARQFLQPNVQKISVTGEVLTVSLVDQKYLTVQPWDKRPLLLHLLKHEQPDTTIVFCKTKATVHKLTKYLRDKGVEAREIHGDMQQGKRNTVMKSLRSGNLSVLVASDLAARGLDVEHISHVINYDVPEDPEIYIHRIGRTARAGRRGNAWSFVTPDDGALLTNIEKLAGVMIEKMEYPDFKPSEPPEEHREAARQHKERTEPKVAQSVEQRMSGRVLAPHLQGLTEAQLKAMFPDGVIPSGKPPTNIGGRFRTRRSD